MEKPPAATYVTVPPRREHTRRRTAHEEEQAVIEARVHQADEQPLMAFVRRQAMAARAQPEQTGRATADLYGSAATMNAILMSTSRHLEHEARQLSALVASYQLQESQRRNRGAGGGGGFSLPTAVRQQPPKSRVLVAGSMLGQQKHASDSDEIGIVDFFKDDTFPETEALPPSPVHTTVATSPMFRALAARYDAFHQPGQIRHNLDREFEKLPRPTLPEVTRQMRVEAMLPPRDGIDRLCKEGGNCMFRIDPAARDGEGRGYTGRAFYLPGEDAATDERPRPCVLCLDASVKEKTLQAQQERMIPTVPFNSYVVSRDRRTGYPPDLLLIVEGEKRATGIVGNYPDYSEAHYDFRPVPRDMALRQGYDLVASKGPILFKVEVGLSDTSFFH